MSAGLAATFGISRTSLSITTSFSTTKCRSLLKPPAYPHFLRVPLLCTSDGFCFTNDYVRRFSTGRWFIPTSGKLFEKINRKKEARKRREAERLSQNATAKRRRTPAELKSIPYNPRMAALWGTFNSSNRLHETRKIIFSLLLFV